jgi:hypothetical protein
MSRGGSNRGLLLARQLLVTAALVLAAQPLDATDYILTIGGGYSPSGNQASLEANVLFFQQLLTERHRGARSHTVFFADGNDPAADVEVLAPQPPGPKLPATEVLAALHRRRSADRLEYRNHRVPAIAGALDPELIHAKLSAIAREARQGDRLIVYVTSHGSAGPDEDPFNTTIDCWNDKHIAARDFEAWLCELKPEVPVVMVMAQCYCGGFARTIFHKSNPSDGPAPQLRAGFFAQQHDLPAAGCRPDIANDDEYSSYFWGAIAGRRRTGEPVADCDIDGDGTISFAEAHAHAVIASRTIDIPLRTSDVLLHSYSRIAGEAASATTAAAEEPPLRGLSGTLQSFADQGRPVSRRIVASLSKELGFELSADATVVIAAYDEFRRGSRGRRPGMRRRGGSGRRELLQAVSEKWPELGDPQRWQKSPLLKPDHQEELLQDLKQLPGWEFYVQRNQQREEELEQAEQRELREVKFRRLIETLKTIALEQNLPTVASPEIKQRFQEIIRLEESSLTLGESR